MLFYRNLRRLGLSSGTIRTLSGNQVPGELSRAQYEADFNLFARRNRGPLIFTRDLTRHSNAFIIDVMRTHPIIVVGSILEENSFCIPPDQFLRNWNDAGECG